MIDVGCGKGFLARKLRELPLEEVCACDITARDAKEGGIRYVKGSITSLPFGDDSFDTVICAHTIEHIRDIGKAVSELRRICRNRLIIVVPRQREYKYTFDLHIHFFPYVFSLQRLLGPSDSVYILKDNDMICIENVHKTAAGDRSILNG